MFDDYALTLLHGSKYRVGKDVHLGECRFESYIKMICVGVEKTAVGVKHFEKIEQKVACVFCGAKIDKKMAHDPRPASSSGLCCGACNMEIVVPERIEAANKDKEETTQ